MRKQNPPEVRIKTIEERTQCPNLPNPFIECLYNDMADVVAMLTTYCLGSFQDCPIFIRYPEQSRRADG